MPRLHGHNYHVATHGERPHPTTLLLHSSGLSGRQWTAYLTPLAALGGRVLVPDLCGYGESEAYRGQGSFHYATDLSAMLELVSGDDAPLVLVGHSYGGLIALRMAAMLPAARVHALVVYEPVAWGALFARDGEALLQELVRDGFFDDALGGSAQWMQRFVDFWSGPGSWEALGDPGRAQMMVSARKTFEEVRSLCFDWTPASAYAQLTCPTLIMNGTRSPREEQRVCEILAETIPRATRDVIEGAGHLGAAQRGRELGPRVATWLSEQLAVA
jgi:pimeloyl-ACP methyl ester carboxylesterase